VLFPLMDAFEKYPLIVGFILPVLGSLKT